MNAQKRTKENIKTTDVTLQNEAQKVIHSAEENKVKSSSEEEDFEEYEVSEVKNMRLVGCKIYITLCFLGHDKSHDLFKDLQYVRKFDHVNDLLKQFIEHYSTTKVVVAIAGKIEYKSTELMGDSKDAAKRRERRKYFFDFCCYKHGDFLAKPILICLFSLCYLTTYEQIDTVVAGIEYVPKEEDKKSKIK